MQRPFACLRVPFVCLVGIVFLLAAAQPAFAITKRPPSWKSSEATEPAAPPAAEAKEEEPAPPSEPAAAASKDKGALGRAVLDRRYRFSKRWQSEFGFFGGDYLGDEWHNSWDVGGRYYLHINNDFAFGAEYFYSPIYADSGSEFAQSLSTKTTHTIAGAMMYSNDAAFRAGDSIVECDLILTVGGGAIQINRQWQWMALIGGGLKIYTPAPWFAVRFDVNSYMHPTPKPNGNSFNADMAIHLGASFLFPTKKLSDEKEGSSLQ